MHRPGKTPRTAGGVLLYEPLRKYRELLRR